MKPNSTDIILYSSPEGHIRVEVVYDEETFWLSQKRMAELFAVEVNTINYHLKEIFKSEELQEERTIRKIRIVQQEGTRSVQREVDFYNLDAIIAVGYRVNSKQATQFRIWATKVLREFIIKGFVLDDERLKQGSRFGKDYFDECSNEFGRSGPANADSISKLPTSMSSVALTTIRMRKSLKIFSKPYKINCTGPLQDTQQQS